MKTILVADDSLFMRTVIKDILADRYTVVEAGSGRECLKQFELTRPDLVLLDVVMPDGEEEGLRVLKWIMSADPEAKVVMITALGQQDAIVKECMSLGAKGCIDKPFKEEQILGLVADCLASGRT